MNNLTIAYLNGAFIPLKEARIPAMDRGFLYGDAVYEVLPVYQGQLFSFAEHHARLMRSLNAIKLISPCTADELQNILQELVQRNGNGDQYIYLQITRGPVEIRDLPFPKEINHTIFAYSTALITTPIETIEKGTSVITYPDIRWQHCYIKTTNLLGNVLARQAAIEANAQEAILIRDGNAMEGTASNLFVVHNNILITPPADGHILGGVTRDFIIKLARKNGISVEEKNISEELLLNANEVWLTNTTREIVPVIKINQHIIGEGVAGPMWHKMINHYRNFRNKL